MSLKERVYSILILSSPGSFSSAFSGLLVPSRYAPVHTVTSVSAAKRLLAETSFDFIIVNSPLSDETGVRFAMDASMSRQSAVLLIVKSDVHATLHDKVAEYGVFTLPKPISKSTLYALGWMESAREHLRLFEKKSLSIEEKMAEIRLINKAKWLLIRELNMTEPDAHHYIEKQAMNQCISKKIVAERILKTYG